MPLKKSSARNQGELWKKGGCGAFTGLLYRKTGGVCERTIKAGIGHYSADLRFEDVRLDFVYGRELDELFPDPQPAPILAQTSYTTEVYHRVNRSGQVKGDGGFEIKNSISIQGCKSKAVEFSLQPLDEGSASIDAANHSSGMALILRRG